MTLTTARERGSQSTTESFELPAISAITTHVKEKGHNERRRRPKFQEIDLERQTLSSGEEGQVIEPDPVFGNEEGAAIHYRTMEWWHASIVMLAETISLGVLALPRAVAILGLVPGLLLIFVLGIIAGYTGYIIGQFKRAYPGMQSFADCGMLIAGPIGYWIMAISQVLILVFIQGAHVLSFAIAMNAIFGHKTCTIVWGVVGMVICFLATLPRTLKGISYLSISSCISVIGTVVVALITIGIAKPDIDHVTTVRHDISLVKGLGPVMNIILAYGKHSVNFSHVFELLGLSYSAAGHVAFFTISAELKNPRDFTKALFAMQGFAIIFYLVISAFIYFFAGPHVSSPALGSASPLVTKICFGIALPTIVVAGVVNGSVACKFIYVKMWTGTNVIHQKNFKSIGSWVAICAVAWVLSWLIAEAIPQFDLLLGFIAALFCSWFSYGLPGGLWLYMNKGHWFETKSKTALMVLNIGIFLLGFAICIMGLWSSGIELANGAAGQPFSCANNWHPMRNL
ncbi:amino acid transporter [Zopfia rhizophila CBS 207.26]|uniref:Amino acid transporter n=1 Tax=Zopfia rhizophila CBS 207.26 TaxID=1314779 RepID=A0A6A6DJL9_9PEZI|nr:amino acid transporter [Zopfia rhizophila CBS 207.26]